MRAVVVLSCMLMAVAQPPQPYDAFQFKITRQTPGRTPGKSLVEVMVAMASTMDPNLLVIPGRVSIASAVGPLDPRSGHRLRAPLGSHLQQTTVARTLTPADLASSGPTVLQRWVLECWDCVTRQDCQSWQGAAAKYKANGTIQYGWKVEEGTKRRSGAGALKLNVSATITLIDMWPISYKRTPVTKGKMMMEIVEFRAEGITMSSSWEPTEHYDPEDTPGDADTKTCEESYADKPPGAGEIVQGDGTWLAIQKKEEGGRHTPFHNKYRPEFRSSSKFGLATRFFEAGDYASETIIDPNEVAFLGRGHVAHNPFSVQQFRQATLMRPSEIEAARAFQQASLMRPSEIEATHALHQATLMRPTELEAGVLAFQQAFLMRPSEIEAARAYQRASLLRPFPDVSPIDAARLFEQAILMRPVELDTDQARKLLDRGNAGPACDGRDNDCDGDVDRTRGDVVQTWPSATVARNQAGRGIVSETYRTMTDIAVEGQLSEFAGVLGSWLDDLARPSPFDPNELDSLLGVVSQVLDRAVASQDPGMALHVRGIGEVLGMMRIRKGVDLGKAAVAFEQAALMRPSEIEAARAFQQANVMRPSEIEATLAYARANLMRPSELEAAIAFERANVLRPTEIEAARLFQQAGRMGPVELYNQAVHSYQQAGRMRPTELYEQAARAYQQVSLVRPSELDYTLHGPLPPGPAYTVDSFFDIFLDLALNPGADGSPPQKLVASGSAACASPSPSTSAASESTAASTKDVAQASTLADTGASGRDDNTQKNGCPSATPVKCWDGSCRVDGTECMPPSSEEEWAIWRAETFMQVVDLVRGTPDWSRAVHEGNDIRRVFATDAAGTPASSEACVGDVQTSERAFPTEIELPVFDSFAFGPAGAASRNGTALSLRVKYYIHAIHAGRK